MDTLTSFEIRLDNPLAQGPAAIIASHLDVMRSITPPESVHAKDGQGLTGPDVWFYGLYVEDQIVAVGAFQRIGPNHAEIKSMHTLEMVRGRGAGEAMLRHIVEQARGMGFERLSLETGSTEHFAPARRLYARFGFETCGPFGSYSNDPHSTFMTRALT